MDYNVQSNIKKTVFSDIKEITNTNVDWNRFNGKTVLITGAGGFIGYYLVLTFLARNDFYNNNIKLLAFVRNRERAEKKFGVLLERDDIELVVADVTNKIECERADFIIHAASQASNIQFETDPVGTINANLSGTSNILDFGCGSGRDTKYFLQKGHAVDATDGCMEFCRQASDYTGISVKQMLFQELNVRNVYDGIWACSSILHLDKCELADVMVRMVQALKTNGVI